MNILVTGGSSGLGEAITRKLASDPANMVYFTYCHSKNKAAQIEQELPNTKALQVDLCSTESLQELFVQMDTMDLDGLINNAYSGGDPVKTHFYKINPDEILADFQHNVLSTVQITQKAIGIFRKKKKGNIVTVLTSYLINTPPLGLSIYVANKAYLKALVTVWASENNKFNISSNAVSPSFMMTNMTQSTDERIIEQLVQNHPLKKLLPAEEVAEAVAFLTKVSPQFNGIDLPITAGVLVK